MIGYFLDEVDAFFPRVRAALGKNDREEVRQVVHRMKGTLVYLGAQPAREAALRVEQSCKSGGDTTSDVEEAVNALERECLLLKTAVSRHLLAADQEQGD